MSDDSLQDFVDPWWIEDDGKSIVRGRLIRVHLPHVTAEQAWLEVEGRKDAAEHTKAKYSVTTPLRIAELNKLAKRSHAALPAAAVPPIPSELLLVSRARLRPALVMGVQHPPLPTNIKLDQPGRWVNPTITVAPVYSVGDGREAPSPEFLRRVRRCEYPSYLHLDMPREKLPSIVRFDQLQPVGATLGTIELTPHRLSDDAVALLDDWMQWLFAGTLAAGSMLDVLREGLMALPAPE